MPRPVHFEISADDPDRAVQLYSSVFGWKFDKWGGPMEYWVITTGRAPEPGIDGGMSRRSAGDGNSNTIGVDSVDDALKKS
jgi:predicted enzyme related to lactoylglutathione lyase